MTLSTPPIAHYENFPVASFLCPPHLRPAIVAIYHFARTADDLADEGEAAPAERLADLERYRAGLCAAAAGQTDSGAWPQVFVPLAAVIHAFALPLPLLTDLLDAFEQDIRFTAAGRRYANDAELLDYCSRSANPVGRLLLHLYGITDELSLHQSDQVCSALQLINFWQDVSVDVARGRWYPSLQAMAQLGVTDADLQPASQSKNASDLIAFYARKSRATMLKGSQLVHSMPGRAGWELRLVVQGGLRILDKIEALDFATWRTRPKLNTWDVAVMLWRALWMRKSPP
ncbi:MAG: squalene synthase HpnC [Rhodoferax sp.]|uniref:squalene synthase HpnC n=1 Tax=Rhodoferax sp. TaxID=50421 RepID=UPI00261CAB57|nr:squalene synthase HpnC [Rhodoferax sp.]MDD2881459.1 squalene synthase HpnC [Rhodoferax sp.]